MTIATQLLDDLARCGATVQAHGDNLRIHPRDAPTPEMLDRLRAHKAELLRLLTTTIRCPWCRSTDLITGRRGIWCQQCEQLAWRPTQGGGAVRADCANERYVDMWPTYDQATRDTSPIRTEVKAAMRPHQQTLLD